MQQFLAIILLPEEEDEDVGKIKIVLVNYYSRSLKSVVIVNSAEVSEVAKLIWGNRAARLC